MSAMTINTDKCVDKIGGYSTVGFTCVLLIKLTIENVSYTETKYFIIYLFYYNLRLFMSASVWK